MAGRPFLVAKVTLTASNELILSLVPSSLPTHQDRHPFHWVPLQHCWRFQFFACGGRVSFPGIISIDSRHRMDLVPCPSLSR
ncbi:hypothetical protein TNCV_1767731 [Trichonephila clavipes]|nr:hypothetical protein TNCV_1767731 [Trichonephila clavipes]